MQEELLKVKINQLISSSANFDIHYSHRALAAIEFKTKVGVMVLVVMKIKNIPANKLMGNGTSRVNEACKIYQGREFDRALSVSPNSCQLHFQ